MIYVATFHGDIGELPPIAAHTLEECLFLIRKTHDYGKRQSNDGFRTNEYITPDPEDDKIEVWEFDPQTHKGRVICGFFGWHWTRPEGAFEMILPGNDKSLMDLAMEDY